MGAKGTFIGRSYIYGLGALGKPGVTKALEIIHKELDVTMALCGETDIHNVAVTTWPCNKMNHASCSAFTGRMVQKY